MKQEPKRITGPRHQKRRLSVWRINPHCAMCGRLVAWPNGFELDHIVPWHKTHDDSIENLQVLCHPHGCHDIKTRKDLGQVERVEFDEDGRVRW